MEIIPAIDIIGGTCVRLTEGDFDQKKTYSASPLSQAKKFQKAGFKKIHLIDLDGARDGKIKNWETVQQIAKETDLKIEFGGGIRSEEDIAKLLKLGVDKIILGSLILKDWELFKRIVKKFEGKIIAAVDTRKDTIYTKGWQEKSAESLFPFLEKLSRLGVKTAICTDIEQDGKLLGPNISLYKSIIEKFPGIRLVASGGIKSAKDLRELSKIGVTGTIVGKAIYEKKIKLNDLANNG